MITVEKLKAFDPLKKYSDNEIFEIAQAYNDLYFENGQEYKYKFMSTMFKCVEQAKEILFQSKYAFIGEYFKVKNAYLVMRYDCVFNAINDILVADLNLVIPSEFEEVFEKAFFKIIGDCKEVEKNIIQEYFESKKLDEIPDIFKVRFNKVFIAMDEADVKEIFKYNLIRLHKQLRHVQLGKKGLYYHCDQYWIKDEKTINPLEVIGIGTVIESKAFDSLCNFLAFTEEESKKFKIVYTQREFPCVKDASLLNYLVENIYDINMSSELNKVFANVLNELDFNKYESDASSIMLDYNKGFAHNKLSNYIYSLEQHDFDENTFLSMFAPFSIEEPSSLTIEDYSYLKEEIIKLEQLMDSSKGRDVLIWGAPGYGKTELVKILAKQKNKKILNINSNNKTKNEFNNKLEKLIALKKISANKNEYIILVDEAESILTEKSKKGEFNYQMDNKCSKVFWIVNDLEGIHEAYLRRFDYVLELNQMPFEKREELAAKMLGTNNINGLSIKIAHAMNSPAEIVSAIEWCQETNDFSWNNFSKKIIAYQNVLSKSSININGGFEITVSPPNKEYGFNSYAGYDYIKNQIKEDFEILKNREEYRKHNAKIPKGLLLMGSFGVGKSMLARCIANEYEMNLVTAKATSLASDPERIKYLFDKAKSIAPCIVFLDELDVLGSNVIKPNGEIDTSKQKILNSLLVEMDGFDKFEGVLVIGATHRSSILDESLLRNGRFGKRILLRYPEMKDREAIFKHYAKDKNIDKNINFEKLADISESFSSADIAESVNNAVLKSIKRKSSYVQEVDFIEAIDEIFFGVKTDGLLMTTKEKWATAIHEAGHALISLKNGREVQRATIRPHQKFLGLVQLQSQEGVYSFNLEDVKKEIQINLAGMMAEKLIFGDYSNGNIADLEAANKMLMQFLIYSGKSNSIKLFSMSYINLSNEAKISLEKEIMNILEEQEKITFNWLLENQNKLVDFAKILYTERYLTKDFINIWSKKNININENENKEGKEEDFTKLVELAYKKVST